MTHVTAWPTLEWLDRTTAAGHQPIRRATDRPAIGGRIRANVPALFAADAYRRFPQVTTLSTSTWVATPLGEQCVDVSLRLGHRRIGIQFSHRYEMKSRQIDALCLVYGRYDVLFRVDANVPSTQVRAALAALEKNASVPGVYRMRLCCASDWVPDFESALNCPGTAS